MPTLEWILERLPVLVFVLVAIMQIVRAVFRSREAQAEHEENFDETEEQRRIREIQERIRRTIAARREGAPPPIEEMPAPPVLRAPVPDLERGEDPFRPPAPPPLREPQVDPAVAAAREAARNLELERQAALAAKMRELSEAREPARRRAAAAQPYSPTVTAAVAQSRQRRSLVDSLHNPESLREAFLLREVLGPPVSLR